VEAEVEARLHALRVRLDAGSIQDTPEEFHSRCSEVLESLRAELQTASRPPLSLLQGAMYDLTHRCLHRFARRDFHDVFGGATPPPAGDDAGGTSRPSGDAA